MKSLNNYISEKLVINKNNKNLLSSQTYLKSICDAINSTKFEKLQLADTVKKNAIIYATENEFEILHTEYLNQKIKNEKSADWAKLRFNHGIPIMLMGTIKVNGRHNHFFIVGKTQNNENEYYEIISPSITNRTIIKGFLESNGSPKFEFPAYEYNYHYYGLDEFDFNEIKYYFDLIRKKFDN